MKKRKELGEKKIMNKYSLIHLIPIGIFVLFVIILIIQFDCMNRSFYWNDRGFFIDSWEYHSMLECDYPPIEESN